MNQNKIDLRATYDARRNVMNANLAIDNRRDEPADVAAETYRRRAEQTRGKCR
jgi:hypothetical protein